MCTVNTKLAMSCQWHWQLFFSDFVFVSDGIYPPLSLDVLGAMKGVGVIVREKSFHGLKREKSQHFGPLVGGAEERLLWRATPESLPTFVEDLRNKLDALEQKEEEHAFANEAEHESYSTKESERVDRLIEDISRAIGSIKGVIWPEAEEGSGGGGGGGGEESSAQQLIVQLEKLVMDNDVFPKVLYHFTDFTFESRKELANIFVYFLGREHAGTTPKPTVHFAQYLEKHPKIVSQLVCCYDHESSALPAGIMLRELVKRNASIQMGMLVGPEGDLSDSFKNLMKALSNPQFDIASDAFETFKTVLTTNHNENVAKALHPEEGKGLPGSKGRCGARATLSPRSLPPPLRLLTPLLLFL